MRTPSRSPVTKASLGAPNGVESSIDFTFESPSISYRPEPPITPTTSSALAPELAVFCAAGAAALFFLAALTLSVLRGSCEQGERCAAAACDAADARPRRGDRGLVRRAGFPAGRHAPRRVAREIAARADR